MGNAFAAKGLPIGSTLHESISKYPKS